MVAADQQTHESGDVNPDEVTQWVAGRCGFTSSSTCVCRGAWWSVSTRPTQFKSTLDRLSYQPSGLAGPVSW